ncbi:hypothetical protein C0993_011982 [Termitomyces sp. T159_Od127]|nr:hypothetical protein C0993_011982 [Termitomyces sp. T159_Od127]
MKLSQSVPLVLFAIVTVILASEDPQGNLNSNRKGNCNDHKPLKVVKGKVFDRIIQIWFENVDFDTAAADRNSYRINVHETEVVGGEYFGVDNDDFHNLPSNISTIADLLEDKKVSWGEYQEGMPHTGFTGSNFSNPITGKDDYVRKHNPLVIFDSVNENNQRLANIKNSTLFKQDLANNALPQWVFITPNMLNDGHDTNVTFAGNWTRTWLEPLLEIPNFNSKNTLIMLTFDESGNGTIPNRVFTVILGNALPKNLIGKTDDTFYTHYSTIATIEANWNLHTLGRWDVGANVFKFVAEKTGDTVRQRDTSSLLLNASYPGIFSEHNIPAKQPVPNTELVINGRTVLPDIKKAWQSQQKCTGYHGQLIPPSNQSRPIFPAGC